MSKLNILKWKITLDYPGWPSEITTSYKEEIMKFEEEHETMEPEVGIMFLKMENGTSTK